MDGVHVGDFGGTDYCRDIQITFAQARGTDTDGFVCEPHVQGIAIGLAVDSDGFDAEFLAGANDAQRNLAAVRN